MYFVKYGNQYLHDPRSDDYILLDLSLECEENTCGYCDFTIYPNHPLHGKLKERDTVNLIEVYDDETLMFSGFIYELGQEFKLEGHVKCKGELSYLTESIVRPYSTVPRGYGDYAPSSVNGYFAWLIEQHNNQVDDNKKFVIGINQGAALDPNNYIYRESNLYPTTMDELEDKLLDPLGGYVRIRYEDGVKYIDYISEWVNSNSQILDFGVNLLDFSRTDDAESIATYIIPLGAKMSETEYEYNNGYIQTTDEEMQEEKEYYTHTYERSRKIVAFEEGVTYYEKYTDIFETSDSGPVEGIYYYTRSDEPSSDGEYTYSRVDISSFKDGVTYYEQEDVYIETEDAVPTDEKDYYIFNENSYSSVGELGRFKKYDVYYEYDENLDESSLPLTIEDSYYTTLGEYTQDGDMIYCKSAVDKYGYIGYKYEDSEIFTKEDLIDTGIVVLNKLISPRQTIEIKAVDMHLINPDIKPIRIGEYVRVRSLPHDFDSFMLCTKIDLDLNNPENSAYVLGSTFDTLTGEQNKKIKELNAAVEEAAKKQYEAAEAISEESKRNAIRIDELNRLVIELQTEIRKLRSR